MKYGVCGEPGIATILAEAGYDYIELHVERDLQTGKDETAFKPQLAQLQALAVPPSAANCFLPGSLKITGPDVDPQALKRYATTAFDRAERTGIETIVFGSGGARRVPEGFDRQDAWAQLLDFGRMIAPIAAEHGITVVVEPLNRRECNIFNSVGESADYVRQIGHPHLRLLVDAYHWALEKDSYEDLVEVMPLIQHAHIATYESRMAPGLEACDFSSFAQALREGGYDGRLSIEGRWTDMGREAAGALAELKRAIEGG
ncbi:MAG: sugar phosphate isomerase/epimerase [Anaerolineae bacterium]|nr:sugar phosphate isomerase/epimerase [Anaerolineae bacterium]